MTAVGAPADRAVHDLNEPGRRRALVWFACGAIVVAWLLGFTLRAVWLAGEPAEPEHQFQGHRLLATADAYYHASGVRAEVTGFPIGNPRVPTSGDGLLIALASGAASALGLAVEDVSLWLPALFAPLVALPLILLALLIGRPIWGFLAALLAVIGYSYWNRTIPGYFDTDALTIPYLYGVVALVIAGFLRRSSVFGAAAALLAVAAPWVHPGSEHVVVMLVLGALGYVVVFERASPHAYHIVCLLLLALLPWPWWLCCASIVALALVFQRVRLSLLPLVALTLMMFAVVAWRGSLAHLLRDYLGIDLIGGGYVGPDMAKGIRFPGVGDSVSELADATFAQLGERVAGHWGFLVSGALGLAGLCWRYRPLLLLGPLVLMGTVIAASAHRYTIFAVPAVALGNAWLMQLLAQALARRLRVAPRLLAPLSLAVLMSPQLVLAGAEALRYPRTTALRNDEAVQLQHLRSMVAPGDFVIAWWDYAYSVWYFSGARTIIDGAKQNRDVWLVAEILFTASQREAASLARLAAEKQVRYHGIESMMTDLLNTFHETSGRPVRDFVPALRAGEVALPPATRAVYLYLPWRFVAILPSVVKVRSASGLVPEAELAVDPFLLVQTDARVLVPAMGGWVHDARFNALVSQRGDVRPVHEEIEVTSAGGRIAARRVVHHPDGNTCVAHLRHIDMRIFMSRDVCQSVLAQLLFFVAPDPQLFTLVSFGRGGAVYRVLL